MITVERAANETFRSVGMSTVADDPPPSLEDLTAFIVSGIAWVFSGSGGDAIAYLLAERLDGRIHIEQVSVHPGHAHRGIGAALIETASRRSADLGLDGLSLTTFANVPWNAPYYSSLGFTELAEANWTAGLRQRVDEERERGLDEWPRVVMVRGAVTS